MTNLVLQTRSKGSIRTQMALGFGCVLALMVLLAGVAVHRVNEVNASLATINDVNSVKQRYAINFRGSVHDRAISLRDVVLVSVPAERDAALADITRLAADYANSARRLDAMMASGVEVTGAEQRILASIQETEARTMPVVAQVIASHRAGDTAQALALLMDQARPAFIEWLARINQFIDLQEGKNRLIAQQTRGVAEGFQLLMVGLLAGGLLLGIMVALWATRAIKPLRDLSQVMLRMAESDFTAAIPGRDRRDEVGRMAHAVEVFRIQGLEGNRLRAEQDAMREAAQAAQTAALRGMADQVESGTAGAMDGISRQARRGGVTVRCRDRGIGRGAVGRVDPRHHAAGAGGHGG